MITARPALICAVLVQLVICLNSVQCELPDLSKTSREPVITVANSDAYLSCKVESLGENTVLFKRIDPKGNGRILTAAQLTVTSDKRFSTLHERRHTTWLLRIQNTTVADSGLYLCEVSSNPPVRITKLLKVLPAIGLVGRPNASTSKTKDEHNNPDAESGWPPISLQELNHNYTDCCMANGVPDSCFEYCEFSSLLVRNRMQSGGPVHSPTCWKHVGSIAKCLADGRNHAPCCERQQVPNTCLSICRGQFTADKVREYFTCADYVAPVLACVAQGIRTLPPPPQELEVKPFSDHLTVQWKRPKLDADLIEQLQLNVTQLQGFDEPGVFVRDRVGVSDMPIVNTSDSSQPPPLIGLQYSIRLPANQTEFNVTNLKPFTVYEVVMQSRNRFGQSLPSEQIRVITRLSTSAGNDDARIADNLPPPGELAVPAGTNQSSSAAGSSGDKQLPDMRRCCIDRGVKLDRCVDVMCDPTNADKATLADLMICAPWANITFSCLANKVDHRPCCTARGVPNTCRSFCDGSVGRLDFRHFICVQHMATYQSCVLQHYDVLPGAPVDFHMTSVHASWAVFRWKAPVKNANRITNYHIHYRRRLPGESAAKPPAPFEVIESSQSPFLLDALEPNTRYEVWIAAANQYGLGTPSARLIFITPPPVSEETEEESSDPSASGLVENKPLLINNGTGVAYNETQCCVHANVSAACMPLCTYDVRVQDVLRLSGSCADQFSSLIRCGSGGRNHIPCCQRRGVQENCLNLCAGIVDTSPITAANRCSSNMGKILQCMEEGTGLIPGQPKDVRAIKVTNTSIQLLWRNADEDKESTAITYQVRYGKVDLNKPLHPLDHEHTLNSTNPMALVTGLEPEHTYSIYVLAGNSYGVSLPSLVLLVNTSQAEGMLRSVVGPPHALELLHQSVDTLTFTWLPPLFIPPDCIISYVVHYRPVNGTELRFMSGSKNENGDTTSAGTSVTTPVPTTPKSDGWIRVPTKFNTMIITNLTYNTLYALAVQARVTFRNESATLANETNVPTLPASRRKVQSSGLSEMLLIWTDPAIPASVNLPLIIPNGPVIEGKNATALCVATGTPTPTLSIFVDGVLKRRAERRHLTYTMVNVTRNVSTVTCYAINGYGQDMQSAQSTLELKVRFPPSILTTSPEEQVGAILNSTARLQCQVTGNPQPIVTWHRQTTSMEPVQLNDNVDVIASPHNELPFTWINTLLIKNLDAQKSGKYMCEANNYLGKARRNMELKVDTSKVNNREFNDCCERENVSPKCMKVCHFDIDIQLATTIPECYKDLDKLMFCAADGSDHRQCCRRNQVPPGCVQWCRGTKSHSNLKDQSAAYCALAASPTIVKCFQEGSVLLPGPVHHLRLLRYSSANRTALVEWNVPDKNADLVQFYRVYYRPIGSNHLIRNTTNTTKFELSNIDTSKLYEFVVKAGNSFGLSVFSDPLVVASNISARIRPEPEAIDLHSNSAASGIGHLLFNLVAALTCVALVLFIAYYTYDRFSYKIKPPPGSMSFENPSYLKDTNQVMLGDVHHLDTINNNQIGAQSNQNLATTPANTTSSEGFAEFKDLFK